MAKFVFCLELLNTVFSLGMGLFANVFFGVMFQIETKVKKTGFVISPSRLKKIKPVWCKPEG